LERTEYAKNNYVEIMHLISDRGDKISEGFLIFILRHVAARKYKINLDNKNVVKMTKELDRKSFNPIDKDKNEYVTTGKLPAFIINLDEINSNDCNNHFKQILICHNYIKSVENLSLSDLCKMVENDDSLEYWCIKFLIAHKFQRNLDNDNCVDMLSSIFNYCKNIKWIKYYGLHMDSSNKCLLYAIYTLLYDKFDFPLVISDNIIYNKLYSNSENASGYVSGNCTVFGTYKDNENDLLAIKSYNWNNDKNCYKVNQLVFKTFNDIPIKVGNEWHCSHITI
jgi:hypothetical protein